MIQRAVPLGFVNLGSLSQATGVTPPSRADFALIRCSGGGVNWRDDGEAPTATAGGGFPMADTDPVLEYAGDISALEFIEQSGSTASVQILFYSLSG